MVTLLTEIGNGRIKFELITDLLSGKSVFPSGIKPAPPENLVLVETVVPFRMKSNKNSVRMIRKELLDQLERYKRSINTIDNIIDHFSDPRLISQRSTKSQNQSGS